MRFCIQVLMVFVCSIENLLYAQLILKSFCIHFWNQQLLYTLLQSTIFEIMIAFDNFACTIQIANCCTFVCTVEAEIILYTLLKSTTNIYSNAITIFWNHDCIWQLCFHYSNCKLMYALFYWTTFVCTDEVDIILHTLLKLTTFIYSVAINNF